MGGAQGQLAVRCAPIGAGKHLPAGLCLAIVKFVTGLAYTGVQTVAFRLVQCLYGLDVAGGIGIEVVLVVGLTDSDSTSD